MGTPTRDYRLGRTRRAVNQVMAHLIRCGLAPRHNHLLLTVGRRSGLTRTTPVTLVERDGGRWLVAPYGPVPWVHNARAAGRVQLRRGRRTQTCSVTELDPHAAAPVLRTYLSKVAVVRPFFDVGPGSTDEEFVAEAPRHPVFRLTPAPAADGG